MHGSYAVKVADGTLVEGHEGQVVFFDQLLKALCQTVAHASCFFAGIRPLNLTECVVTCYTGNGGRGQGAAAHGFGNLLSGGIKTCSQISHAVLMAADSACSRIAAGDD